MKRIRLKYAIAEFGGTLYEVGLKICRDEEPATANHHDDDEPSGNARQASEAQQAQRQLFKLALAYAREALADPQLRTHYEEKARQQGKRPRDAARSDYLRGNDLLTKK